jgi:transposase
VRQSGPRFIHEFELAPTPQQARLLRIRLDLARQLYNLFLGEALARLQRCRRDPRWREASRLKRAGQAREAKALYAAVMHDVVLQERVRAEPDFTGTVNTNLKHPASGIMTRFRQAHFAEHLDFKTCQAMATRAYQAVNRLRFARPTRRPDGTRKFPRVHFVPYGEARAVDSVSIHWRGQAIEWNSPAHPMLIPVRFDQEDTKGIQAHALAQMQDPNNICASLRVLSRTIRGTERWYVQITIKGHPKWKEQQYPPGHGKTVGIDFGPSRIGLCWEEPDGTLRGVKLELAEGLRHDYATIRRLQRVLDRSRRAMNPELYQADGTIRRGVQKRQWRLSRRYLRAKAELAELWRRYAARRKNALGRLANQILAHGTMIKIEALSYKAWQHQWGKSIGRGAPGLLVQMLRQKAQACGGQLIEFSTRHTKCSQFCHGCGTYTKKPLSQRIHQCACGVGPVDRDVYSAFLAYHVDLASNTLDIGAARAAFAALQCGAVDIQATPQAASAIPSQGTPSPRARGDQSGSTALRALPPAKAPADQDAGERLESIPPNFQGLPIIQGSARIAADIPPPGDARSALVQEPCATATLKARRGPPWVPTQKQCSQKAEQLWLFPWLGRPGDKDGGCPGRD